MRNRLLILAAFAFTLASCADTSLPLVTESEGELTGDVATAVESTLASSTSRPNPPTDATATAISSTEMLIEWTDNSDNENGFVIQRRNDNSWNTAGTRRANRESFTDSGLDPDTEYQYRVRACHATACGNSEDFFGTTGDPNQSKDEASDEPGSSDDDVDEQEPGRTLTPPTTVSGSVPAFPGAEGWGASALNESRRLPLEVHFVTSISATGSGTLHEAIQNTRDDRYDVILFRTGGVIRRPSNGFEISSSHVYIAGQTAPGDGIAIDGRNGVTMWIRGSGGNASDIVLRHFRIREASVSLNISRGNRIILDHLSISWASRFLLAIQRYPWGWSHPISNVSVQNSILSEVLGSHPTAFILGTGGSMKEDEDIGMSNISIHRNLFASNSHRNPMTAADNAVIANNVIYNWRISMGMMNRRGTVDWTNNYGKSGPMKGSDSDFMVNPYCDDLGGDFSIYAAGNVSSASTDASGDNWKDPTRQIACMRNSGDYRGQEVPAEWRRNTPQRWASAAFPLNLLSARNAYDAVINDVGANARITCDGRWISAVDAVDARVINETKNRSGPSNSPTSARSWPSYSRGTPCPDADGDGLPDAWEERFFGSRTGARPDAVGRNGYLLIEHYINGTNPL